MTSPAAVTASIHFSLERRMQDHAARKARLAAQFRTGAGQLALRKDTSNLFRDRAIGAGQRLDVRDFNHVLEVNAQEGWVDAEGMTRYEDLVEATLARGSMPAVVPQLKTITLGGAVAGVGIEATSFRHGLVHDTVLEMEILAGDGRNYLCTPVNEHRDLFFGFPNSYGTLGYALRVRARTIPVRKFVRIDHAGFSEPKAYFAALERACASPADFVDGVVFGAGEMMLTTGVFTDQAPFTSDYTFEHIYYRSIRDRTTDYLSTQDYLWRWDTDWFWCSKNLGAQNPLIRRLLGRSRLNSRTYTRIMRWNSRWKLTHRLDWLSGLHRESVIQDVDIPLERAAEFLEFFHREIGILPVWICPIRAADPQARFDLYPLVPGRPYVNFGFWDVVKRREAHPRGHFNRLIERKVAELGGIKSLYSESCYPREEFWAIYGESAYRRLKDKYDPQGRLRDLYDKCVLRA
ncbi:MAG TPA: FAD-binding oxidoreductase [Burkholderiales bacterium]|nr:FAD-binding oxidoreductase [Burkholderiales bacterium]